MRPFRCPHHAGVVTLLVWQLIAATAAVKFDPCSEITAINRGSPIVVGLAYWPGGLITDWGDPTTGLNPCNSEVQANLTTMGVHFATFNIRADRLTVLKTSFPEELMLTAKSSEGAPKVISMVAFRANVRSEARYIVSFEPTVTTGTGFVSSLSLIAKMDNGQLQYLQWFNQTCNDCGGRTSARCLNNTSCGLSWQECACPDNSTDTAATAPAVPCSFANFSYCATGVTMSFEGTDKSTAAFSTAGQVKKLNSFSLVSLYFQAKEQFFNVKDLFSDKTGEYWGKFGAVQDDIQQAYSGNAAATVDQASMGSFG